MTTKRVGRMMEADARKWSAGAALIQRKNSINSAVCSGLANMRGLTYYKQSHAKSPCAKGYESFTTQAASINGSLRRLTNRLQLVHVLRIKRTLQTMKETCASAPFSATVSRTNTTLACFWMNGSDQYERFSLQKVRDFSDTLIRQNF